MRYAERKEIKEFKQKLEEVENMKKVDQKNQPVRTTKVGSWKNRFLQKAAEQEAAYDARQAKQKQTIIQRKGEPEYH